MLKKLVIMSLGILLPLSVLADELRINKDAPKSYVVKKGDTLWDISGVFLKQPWLWPKIWRINPDVNNPHLIYPGDELRLVLDPNGEPLLDADGLPRLVRGKPELRWSPQKRIALKDQSPITIVPLHTVAPYIRYDTLAMANEIDGLPYVVGSEDGEKSHLNGVNAYINGELVVGKSYAAYKKGSEVVDPETNDILGYHLILLASGKATRTGNSENKEPATLYLENVRQEVRSGSIIMPVNEGQMFPSYFTMQAVEDSVRGVVIESSKGSREFGKYEVVMISVGKEDDVNQGDVLTVARKSPGIVETTNGPVNINDASKWYQLGGSDYEMPEEPIGQVMIFRVYEKMSLALILKSRKPMRIQDIVVAP